MSNNDIQNPLPPVPGSAPLPAVPSVSKNKNNTAVILACVVGGLLLIITCGFFAVLFLICSDDDSGIIYDEDDIAYYVEEEVPSQDSIYDKLAQRGIYPSQYEQAIISAAANGASDLLQLLLSAGVDPNTRTSWNYSILSHAITSGHLNCVKILLSHPRIDVNVTDNFGNTLLHCAAQQRNYEIMKLLLKHEDIQINPQNNTGMTPLDFAILCGNTSCVNLLQQAGGITNKNHTPPEILFDSYRTYY